MNWIETWIRIGNTNPWIKDAWDPAFDESSFYRCADVEELKEKLAHDGSWCLGQAFFLGDLCFILQVDGGDEWLTVKEAICFDSITFKPIIDRGDFYALLEDLLKGPESYHGGNVPATWWNWDNVNLCPIDNPATTLMTGE